MIRKVIEMLDGLEASVQEKVTNLRLKLDKKPDATLNSEGQFYEIQYILYEIQHIKDQIWKMIDSKGGE